MVANLSCSVLLPPTESRGATEVSGKERADCLKREVVPQGHLIRTREPIFRYFFLFVYSILCWSVKGIRLGII